MRAVRGERASYRPVVSALCPTAEPVAVARTLLDYCGSTTLYVADLDGLTIGVAQHSLLTELCSALPKTEIWLDAGFARFADAQALLAVLDCNRVTAILASEALVDQRQLEAARDSVAPWIVSLDRKGDRVLDRADCWIALGQWPALTLLLSGWCARPRDRGNCSVPAEFGMNTTCVRPRAPAQPDGWLPRPCTIGAFRRCAVRAADSEWRCIPSINHVLCQ